MSLEKVFSGLGWRRVLKLALKGGLSSSYCEGLSQISALKGRFKPAYYETWFQEIPFQISALKGRLTAAHCEAVGLRTLASKSPERTAHLAQLPFGHKISTTNG